MSTPYSLPPLTYEDQLKQLEERGLSVARRREALEVLATVGYTRLSGFWKPLLLTERKHFQAGASFSQIYHRYQFDSSLRQLTLYAVNHIEVALRSALVYEISHELGTGLWVDNSSIYRSSPWLEKFLGRVRSGLHDSREPWAKHYREHHEGSTPIPPAWIALQFAYFGDLSNILRSLVLTSARAAICTRYGVNHEVLISWINSLRHLRNACAHHARIWNRNLHAAPVWPKRLARDGLWVSTWDPHPAITSAPFTQYRQLGDASAQGLTFYCAACVMKYMIDKINPHNTFLQRLSSLLASETNRNSPATIEAGFSEHWQTEPLWH